MNSVYLDVADDNNSLSIEQGDQTRTTGTFSVDLGISTGSNNNVVTIIQAGDQNKTLTGIVSGSTNILHLRQQGTGVHQLEFSITGAGHTLSTQQLNSGSHTLDIQLVNGGGSVEAQIIQQGTTPQTLQVIQNCANPLGCSISVTQGTN
jgi:hypothetical protein